MDGLRRRPLCLGGGQEQPLRRPIPPGAFRQDRPENARELQQVGPVMLTKRIIPCLDVRNKKVTKGVKFQGNVDLGDPIEMAVGYSDGGCDELVFYDITASAERRPIDIEMVREVGRVIHIPFSVGGGIETLDDRYRVLAAGAEKVSVNSLAVKNPAIIAEGARQFGSQCIVLGMDPVKTEDP